MKIYIDIDGVGCEIMEGSQLTITENGEKWIEVETDECSGIAFMRKDLNSLEVQINER